MMEAYIGNTESIILWVGVAIFLGLAGFSLLVRAMAKLTEAEQNRKTIQPLVPKQTMWTYKTTTKEERK